MKDRLESPPAMMPSSDITTQDEGISGVEQHLSRINFRNTTDY